MKAIAECAECGCSLDSEECWEINCRKIIHLDCLLSCSENGCDGYYCYDHTDKHNCNG